MQKRTSFKSAIKKNGLEKVLKNPFFYLRLKKSEYSKNYLYGLKTKLKKRYGTNCK